jgi:hypothetical protein
MREWSVGLEATTERGTVAPEQVFDLVELLDAHHAGAATLARDGRGVGVHLWVEAPDLKRALAAGERALLGALQRLGLAGFTVVSADVKAWEEAQRGLERRNVPELAGVAELAQALGVSKQRASELAGSPAFPRPLAQLRSGPVWDLAAIGNFKASWRRTPGRPRTSRNAQDAPTGADPRPRSTTAARRTTGRPRAR